MDPMESIRQVYFQECEELLLAMEEGLSAMESGEADSETINAVFRAVHSIKGSGGAFGYDTLVTFAHKFESVLDDLRSGRAEAHPDLMKVLLRAGDILADHVAAVRDNRAPPNDSEISDQLTSVTSGSAPQSDAPAEEADPFGFTPMQIAIDPIPEQTPAVTRWSIRFAPRASMLAKANDPFLILRELKTLGEAEIAADMSRLPPLADMDPDEAYLAWTITLVSAAERAAIEEAFEFVSDDSDISIEKVEQSNPFEAEDNAFSALMTESVAALHGPAADTPAATAETKADGTLQLIETEGYVGPDRRSKSLTDDRLEGQTAAAADVSIKQTIRVDLDKVDRLVNLVGELVITQVMLCQGVSDAALKQDSLVANGLSELEHLTRELQESVMAIRTQPVKSVFQRMPRLVRELGAQTSKKVRLVVDGEGTEVDKTVIERLSEPLTHMIRNAIDHGLETPAERVAKGKPAEGTVRLSAEHRGGRIVIEVADDGRGIDRERVREKAIERGLVSPNANLSDEETDNLIFLPGFSTAAQLSNISGRGVGMDVVRRNILDLGGRVTISSVPQKGSKFSLTLPLTLAVLDGMIVSVGEQTFVLPLAHIVESLKPKREDVRPFGAGSKLIRIRNNYVPLVSIGELLNVPGAKSDPCDGVVILVEAEGTGALALAVGAIVGQQQVVIKSFESNYRHIEGIAAATILGDGRVALILDVNGLVSRCRESQSTCHPIFQTAVGA
jgi:two-component system chemotaxis sensor kinase CheA